MFNLKTQNIRRVIVLDQHDYLALPIESFLIGSRLQGLSPNRGGVHACLRPLCSLLLARARRLERFRS